MAYPSLPAFGIVDNPLVESPFASNNTPGTSFAATDFLLMDGEHFLLMDGSQFLLMGT